MLFSALVMRYVSKISTSNIKMANNKLQVTIIKITESKENKPIQRLDVSCSTGQGGGGSCPPCAPPAPRAVALHNMVKIRTQITSTMELICDRGSHNNKSIIADVLSES